MEIDREYVDYRTLLEGSNRKLAAIVQFRTIMAHCIRQSGRRSTATSDQQMSLGDFMGWMDGTVEQCRVDVGQLEKAVRNTMMDRHSLSMNMRMLQPRAIDTKRVCYRIGGILRSKYSNVTLIPHARVAVVKFRDRNDGLDIDLVINKRIAIHNSDLIKDYMAADRSGKIKKVALLVKSLVKVHHIGDASAGTMSSYSWVVLLLHTLLRHEYLPAFNPVGVRRAGAHFCESYYVNYTVPDPLPQYYQDRLAAVTVAELLIIFTEYVSSRVDVLSDCLTMRGQGETIPKSNWRKDFTIKKCDAYNISIEVPSYSSA